MNNDQIRDAIKKSIVEDSVKEMARHFHVPQEVFDASTHGSSAEYRHASERARSEYTPWSKDHV